MVSANAQTNPTSAGGNIKMGVQDLKISIARHEILNLKQHVSPNRHR